MFSFFLKNNFIIQMQSGFKLGESCTKQLLPITHEIYKCLMIDLKLEAFLYLKPSIKFGIKELFSN